MDVMGFGIHAGPPEPSKEEGKHLINTRMAGEASGVSPLENLGTDRVKAPPTGSWGAPLPGSGC